MNIETIGKKFPLHILVWYNEYRDLDKELTKNEHDKEKRDPRGRTPLMLAVTLGHLEATRILLRHSCCVNVENKQGWTVAQEAVSTGDPEMLQLILEARDTQRYTSRVTGLPGLLNTLKEAPDFYVEMKWEFASWVPLVSRICPHDTYKVYKQGSNVRIDTTLLGFDDSSWQRGSRSYMFKGQNDRVVIEEVDHDTQQSYLEEMKVVEDDVIASFQKPSERAVSTRLTTPIVTTYLDTEKISFERNKAGIWGWRSYKSEEINGHECKVFSASNVELVTKTRTEHLTSEEKDINKGVSKHPLHSFLGIAETEEKHVAPEAVNAEECDSLGNPCHIKPEEYFSPLDLEDRDIGRPKEQTTKVQKFKADVSLCEDYPLSLQEQVTPIVDLMAISSTHFAKLKHFIQMQLPSGFPVKIEIPLFHMLTARITFGNIFGQDEAVEGVTFLPPVDDASCPACVVNDSCFDVPAGYTRLGSGQRRQFSLDEDDELLQIAIQQSLVDAGTESEEVDIWEALKAERRPSRPITPNPLTSPSEEERQLQRAIEESLACFYDRSSEGSGVLERDSNPCDLELALRMSAEEVVTEEHRRREEEETLKRILELSLTEK